MDHMTISVLPSNANLTMFIREMKREKIESNEISSEVLIVVKAWKITATEEIS